MANLKTEELEKNNPEQKLWKAVLGQSIHDSLFGDYRSLQTNYERKEAKLWLDLNNEDFRQVCEYAGLSPYFVFNNVFKALKRKREKNELETKIQNNSLVAKTFEGGASTDDKSSGYESSDVIR